MDILHPKETFFFESFCVKMGKNVCVKNVIKMKLKTNTSLLVLYGCCVCCVLCVVCLLFFCWFLWPLFVVLSLSFEE